MRRGGGQHGGAAAHLPDGLGVGLFITGELVRAHGGAIEVRTGER
jgi:signal transduction histidine kinase